MTRKITMTTPSAPLTPTPNDCDGSGMIAYVVGGDVLAEFCPGCAACTPLGEIIAEDLRRTYCGCCECRGIHCMFYHEGHAHWLQADR